MERPTSVPALDGLTIEAVEWLPSGSDSGLVRVRGRWSEAVRGELELPALVVRRGEEARRFESLPDARFGREATAWRATYLVPAALMEPLPDELSLSWASGARAALPEPSRGFAPPQAPPAAFVEPVEAPGGEVIDRAVIAERRARRAEVAERASTARAAEALKAVEVLELRSAELERRLEALQAAAPAARRSPSDDLAAALGDEESPSSSVAGAPAVDGHDAASLARSSDRRPDVATVAGPPAEVPRAQELTAGVKRLRSELDEQRRRLRKSELLRAADGVALASLREQEGRVQLLERQYSASQADLARALAAAATSAAEARAAREQAAEQLALAQARAASDAAAVRARATEELGAIADELTRVRSALANVRRHAAARAADLERRLSELETALAAERRAHAAAATELETALVAERRAHAAAATELETALVAERRAHAATAAELETARAGFAAAQTINDAEAVARAALEEELDRERLARASIVAALAAERSELAEMRPLLASAHVRIAELERAPRSVRAPLAAQGAHERSGGNAVREHTADGRPEARARDLPTPAPRSGDDELVDHRAAAGVAAPHGSDHRELTTAASPATDERREFSAKLDAAAAALRARTPREPLVAHAGGARSQREYPLLRAALVRLAHDDPSTAARLIVALVPAQSALVGYPLQYDLTIRGAGTYAVSIGAGRATARGIREPRSRAQAAFHVTADAVTLAELLAGVQKRMGRWIGSVRVHGSRRDAEALRDALVAARLDLAAAARAGAELDPDLVWRALAHAIDPAWTRGQTFTIAQEITGPRPLRWHVSVRNGAPVAIQRHPPAQPADAVVAMSRAAFSHLLRGEPAPEGERPAIRGDRAAVALLKGWTDRAQGHAG